MTKKPKKDQMQKDVEESFGGEMSLTNPETLKSMAEVGMRGVDPVDIRPPAILLAQKSSNLTEMVDQDGKEAKVGQYYHTGKKIIFDDFNCYFLFATKKTYIDRRKPEEGEKPMYRALGVMKDDISPFGMTFKSTSLHGLSSLFTASQSQHAPMFAFNCFVETKKLEGKDGIWWIPVVRVREIEKDEGLLNELFRMAKRLDEKTTEVSDQMGGGDEENVGS